MIPPDANAGFVAAMEDVLETYQKPRDPDRPLVCLDETSKQLIIETRMPIAVDVICFFMALLSFRGISTPSLPAQGEQRRSSYFNIHRGDPL